MKAIINGTRSISICLTAINGSIIICIISNPANQLTKNLLSLVNFLVTYRAISKIIESPAKENIKSSILLTGERLKPALFIYAAIKKTENI